MQPTSAQGWQMGLQRPDRAHRLPRALEGGLFGVSEGAAVTDSAYQGASRGILKGLANQQREGAGASKPGETKTLGFRELGSRTAILF